MRYYFIRHGENPANIERILAYKIVDLNLTERGITQATTVAAWLGDKNIQHIYSSPLNRARDTAKIISHRLNLEVRLIDNLREVNVGIYDGRKDQEAWDIHNKMWGTWFQGDYTALMEGGEDGHSLINRLRLSLEQIEQEVGHTTPNVAVVGHGGMFFFGLANLCENLGLEAVMSKHLVNTAICVVEKRQNHYHCLEWGIDLAARLVTNDE
jgi:broad specificity phosphatase PhoE